MKQHNKHIKNFKIFEARSTKIKFISTDDVEEIFIELIDKDYKIEWFEPSLRDSQTGKIIANGKYFFEFAKKLSEEYLGYFYKGSAYGYSKIDNLKKEFDIFDIVDDAKARLNSMGYTIGFEFEFNISTKSEMNIICHLQHSKFDNEEDEESQEESEESQYQIDPQTGIIRRR